MAATLHHIRSKRFVLNVLLEHRGTQRLLRLELSFVLLLLLKFGLDALSLHPTRFLHLTYRRDIPSQVRWGFFISESQQAAGSLQWGMEPPTFLALG